MNEAMALASMNPVVGAQGTAYNKQGAILIDNLNHDKDIENSWGDYSVTRSLDKNDNILSIDHNGKIVNDSKNTLYSNNLMDAYIIKTDNVDEIYNKLLEELNLDYDKRPVHDKNYLYEVFTGHKLLTSDQLKYDKLLECIGTELPKFSKVLSGSNTDQKEEKKDGKYFPDKIRGGSVGTALLSSYDSIFANELLKNMPEYISIGEDAYGYYALNSYAGVRTRSYKDMRDIPLEVIV